MKRPIAPASWAWFIVFALCVILQVGPRLRSDSPTNDEPLELTNGFFFWSGDTTTHNRHPPLAAALQALPSLMGGAQAGVETTGDALERARRFLFVENGERVSFLVASARGVSLLFGLGVGCLIFAWLRRENPRAAIAALLLYAFEPTGLAYSGLAMSDGPLTFFVLASVLAFHRCTKDGSGVSAFGAGVLAGAAITTKFSGLALIPILLLLDLGDLKFRLKRTFYLRWTAWTAGCLLWIGLAYLPGWWGQAGGGPWDSYRAFLNGLQDMIRYGREAHHPSFFLGTAGRQDHLWYFPVAFLLKTPLPHLILLLGCVAGMASGHLKVSRWVWLPAAIFIISILGVQNLGVRYLLPAYPFLIVMAASATVQGLELFRGGQRAIRWSLYGLGAWAVATTLASAPAHLSYFNDLVPKNAKIGLLGDSNLDLGQDVKRLADAAKKNHWPKVRLATSIGVDPGFYGMDWDWWTERDLSGPQSGRVYAVNLSFLQLTPVFHPELTPIAQSWISETPPTLRVGDTWWVWVIPGSVEPDDSKPLASAPGLLRFRALRPAHWPGPIFP